MSLREAPIPRAPTPMSKSSRSNLAETSNAAESVASGSGAGNAPPASDSYLFQVYLRLRPPSFSSPRFLTTHPNNHTQVYVHPPAAQTSTASQWPRAIERFSFTEIFTENSTQRDVFQKTTLPMLVEVVRSGRDGLLATLGVTGSGKTHTILGTKGSKGITQMALEVLMNGLHSRFVDFEKLDLAAIDQSDAVMINAPMFLSNTLTGMEAYMKRTNQQASLPKSKLPNVSDITITPDKRTNYAILLSMYEVYNDRIYDLLDERTITASISQAGMKRKAVHFKKLMTFDHRNDNAKKAVFGLRKIYVKTLDEALRVLEYGQASRHASPTSSNESSSRSHAFFAIEVKRFIAKSNVMLPSGTFQIADLAGSERARLANTQGERLVEAGSINRSLMSLGQCMQLQTQSENGKPVVVPYRQSKLTDLLFSSSYQGPVSQRAALIATADPQGDYNSTAQILRYTALAREVTVPKAPPTGHPALSTAEEKAKMEEERQKEYEAMRRLQAQLEETILRCKAAEDALRKANETIKELEENNLLIEQQVREEISNEFEERARTLKGVYLERLLDEEEAGREFVDGKLEIAMRGMEIDVYEDHDGNTSDEVSERMMELERENEELRMEVLRYKRIAEAKSPIKGKRVRSAALKKKVLLVTTERRHAAEDAENHAPRRKAIID